MATARSIRMIITGDRPTGSFAGEIWQTGLSFVEGDAGGVFPGAIREGLPSFNVATIGEASSDATWQMDWAWKGTDKVTQANQTAMANAAVTFWNAIRSAAAADSRMTGVRINALDGDGKVINGANVFTLKSPIAGSAPAATQMPAQLAIVASLRTGARGAVGRGRMFLPLSGLQSSSGKVSNALQDTIGNGLVTFIGAVRGVGPLAAVVNVGPRTYSSVSQVQVGNYYDVQRKRTRSLRETYSNYPIA